MLIPENTLIAGQTYTIQANVLMTYINSITLQSENSFAIDSCNIEIVPSEIRPLIKGGNRVVSMKLDTVIDLDATDSVDPDYAHHDNNHFDFRWNCEVSFDQSENKRADCLFMNGLSLATGVLVFRSSKLTAGVNYKFRVDIFHSDSQRIATASTIIITSNLNPSAPKKYQQFHVYPNYQIIGNNEKLVIYCPQSDDSKEFKYEWTVFQYDYSNIFTYNQIQNLKNSENSVSNRIVDYDKIKILSNQGKNSINLIIDSQSLQSGKYYIFLLNAFNSEYEGFAWCEIFVKLAPIITKFDVQPDIGIFFSSTFNHR